MNDAIFTTDLDNLKLKNKGKVRDIYDLGDKLLMITTDRMSAFDVVMAEPIPDKGKILTQISNFWFDQMKPLVDNHLLATEVDAFPKECRAHAEMLRERSVVVQKAVPLPVECIVRGYISGSGWKDYQNSGKVCGIPLPTGLKESDRLPEPLFTPSTKADLGAHDENIDFGGVVDKVGAELAEKIRDLSLAIYRKGAKTALEKGIIIADTKFEFGIFKDELILIDEVLTPDSSRFWPVDTYQPGGAQKSFDKQYLRDYLLSIDWNREPPPPPLPQTVIDNTRSRYLEALTRLTGRAYAF
jgi:phosphoribosylaminoimidazole-succinocarboxamide synthase